MFRCETPCLRAARPGLAQDSRDSGRAEGDFHECVRSIEVYSLDCDNDVLVDEFDDARLVACWFGEFPDHKSELSGRLWELREAC